MSTRTGPRTTGTRSRAAGIPSSSTQLRADIVGPAATEGLRNERTRLVGTRTGLGADALITLVRLWRALSGAALHAARQVSAVVTPLGWTMLGVVVAAFLVGYGFGWAELAAVAWAGAVIIVVASLFLIGGHSQGIELTMAHPRVVVGDRAVGGIVAVNPTRRRLLGTTLEIPVGRGLLEFPLPSIAPGATIDDVFVVPTTRRGLITIGPVRSVRADPIGLVRREHVWPGSIELFVHPQTVSIPSMSTGFVRDLEGQATRDLTSSDVAFNALRDYQLGDDRRWIHWKSTAKTGVYMVKQFEETRRSHLMVALSLAGDDYADDEQFELAVSVAGSLGVRAIRDARTVSVVVSERTPEFAKRKTFAVALAEHHHAHPAARRARRDRSSHCRPGRRRPRPRRGRAGRGHFGRIRRARLDRHAVTAACGLVGVPVGSRGDRGALRSRVHPEPAPGERPHRADHRLPGGPAEVAGPIAGGLVSLDQISTGTPRGVRPGRERSAGAASRCASSSSPLCCSTSPWRSPPPASGRSTAAARCSSPSGSHWPRRAIGVLGACRRWPAWAVGAATIAAYLLLGVPAAVPGAAAFGVLPTVRGLGDLVAGSALSWKQLLTISLPVGSYQTLLIPAFLSTLVVTVTAISVGLRARYGELGAIPPVALFLAGILFGPTFASWPLPVALGLLVTLLVYLIWFRARRRAAALSHLAEQTGTRVERGGDRRSAGLRSVIGAAVILALAGGGAVVAQTLAPVTRDRLVLRSAVEVPFDPNDYASPLSSFRRYFQSDRAERADADRLRSRGR